MNAYQNTTGLLVSSQDGFSLFYQKWIPAENINRVLVFQHGIGEHSDRYQNLIQAFAGTGTVFYALDARGHGRSGGKRGHVAHFRQFIDDLHDIIQRARQEQNNQKVFLLGQSLGGAMVLKYAMTDAYQDGLRGLIATSPLIEPVMDWIKHAKKRAAPLMSRIAPSLTMNTGLDIQNLSHNPNVVTAYAADPLVHPKASTRLGQAMFTIHRDLYHHAPKLTIPIYLLHGTADRITNPKSTRKFYALLTAPDKTLKIYEGLYHETMNERTEDRKRVLDELKAWVLAH